MGDRANIVIEKDDSGYFPHEIYFYTHWCGSSIKQRLQTAIKRGKERWDDGQYLSRVIFCDLIGAKDKDGLTGFGITTGIGDRGGQLLCVNMQENKVKLRDSAEDSAAKIVQEWTFEEYIAATFNDDE